MAGFFAVLFPHVIGVATEVMYGILITTLGVFYLLSILLNGSWVYKGLQMSLSWLLLVSGIFMVVLPMKGLVLFSSLVAGAFILQGLLLTVAAYSLKSERFFLLLSAFTAVATGLVIMSQWQIDSHWRLGFLIGTNLLITGLMIIKTAPDISGDIE